MLINTNKWVWAQLSWLCRPHNVTLVSALLSCAILAVVYLKAGNRGKMEQPGHWWGITERSQGNSLDRSTTSSWAPGKTRRVMGGKVSLHNMSGTEDVQQCTEQTDWWMRGQRADGSVNGTGTVCDSELKHNMVGNSTGASVAAQRSESSFLSVPNSWISFFYPPQKNP